MIPPASADAKIRPSRQTKTHPLAFDTAGGGRFDLLAQSPRNTTVVVAYRGRHCPLCRKHLQELGEMVPGYGEQGVGLVTASANQRDLAKSAVAQREPDSLIVGHSLPRETALQWGLHLTAAIKASKPEWFVEPGIFVVHRDRTLFASLVQAIPFSRPTGRQLPKLAQLDP